MTRPRRVAGWPAGVTAWRHGMPPMFVDPELGVKLEVTGPTCAPAAWAATKITTSSSMKPTSFTPLKILSAAFAEFATLGGGTMSDLASRHGSWAGAWPTEFQ